MSWLKKATELGYTETTLSKAIKRKIANYKEVDTSIPGLQKEVDAADAADKPEMEAQLANIKSDLKELDKEITADIIKYYENKDRNAATAKAMLDARKAKKALKQTAATQTQKVAPAAVPIEPIEPVTPPAATTEVVEDPIIEVKKEKKNSNVAAWIIGGLLAVTVGYGVVAVNKGLPPFNRR